jgi:transcriptional regulator with XRE-family HTH domain
MISRIQLILKTKNISPSQFADQIQVQRSGVSHILSGRNNPSLDFILKILRTYPEIDADWLLFGKGQMNTLPAKTEIPDQTPSDVRKKITGQPDLFEQPVTEPPISVLKEEKVVPPVLSLPKKDIEPVMKEKAGEIEKTEKIEKIVVFYDSNTFKEYKPK